MNASMPTGATPPATLLIDANSYGMTSVYNFSELKSKDGQPTGVTHGVLMLLFSLMREYPQALPVLLWDGRAQWRYDLCPDYKSGRDIGEERLRMRELYRKQIAPLREMISLLGIPQIIPEEEEADDVAGHLTARLARHGPVVLCTKDTDWLQVVDENVSWYSHPNKKKRLLTATDFPHYESDYGFANARAYLQASALAGDDSDRIAGIDKVGEKTAAQFLAEWGTPEAFWAACDDGSHAPKGVVRTRMASAESRALYQRNLRLMDWALAPPLRESTSLWTTPYDHDRAKRELLDLQLRVTAEQLDKWTPGYDFRGAVGRREHPLLEAMNEASRADEPELPEVTLPPEPPTSVAAIARP